MAHPEIRPVRKSEDVERNLKGDRKVVFMTKVFFEDVKSWFKKWRKK